MSLARKSCEYLRLLIMVWLDFQRFLNRKECQLRQLLGFVTRSKYACFQRNCTLLDNKSARSDLIRHTISNFRFPSMIVNMITSNARLEFKFAFNKNKNNFSIILYREPCH